MTTRILRTVGLASAAMLFAVSAQAQGRKHGRADDHSHVTPIRRPDVHRRDVNVHDTHRDRYGRYDGRRIPPGLAKKPGQMPPGQFKKRYRTHDGVYAVSEVLRRRGARVVRVVPAGESQYVYYRVPDEGERWVMVRPGADRLYFDNAPPSLLQAVLARLY